MIARLGVLARLGVCAGLALALLMAQQAQQKKGGPAAPPIQPTAAELQRIRAKVEELERIVAALRAKRVDEAVLADVDVYGKSGRWLLEFPETFFVQEGIDQAIAVLDQGLVRAHQLEKGELRWVAQKGRKIHGYYSALDGSVQPYGLTVPAAYDGSKPARLYVWLHGRDQRLSEANFIFRFATPNRGVTYAAADVGQIILDCYGRWNNANHWAGEVDVFEAIAAVQQRYKIDPDRIILRGFSLGGAGAWHIALHHPGSFAAAEIGAGTYPRRSTMEGFPPYQAATLRIWENIIDYSLNAFNLPLAAHDGDSDSGASGIPAPPPGTKHRGQLESSLRVRAQLEKEGFPSEGTTNELRIKGMPGYFLISENTGHSISPKVRGKVDAFLKEHGDLGRVSPDHVRFLTYTTRYNSSHWISLDGLARHYERAEIEAKRDAAREQFDIRTTNLTRVTLREMEKARQIAIDGQKLAVKGAAEIQLEKNGAAWRVAKAPKGLVKTHALQGPIDDAFLDPFLLVRPTGTPWNAAAHEQSLRILERFDRLYARWYRAHPRVKNDTEVTKEDLARYHVVVFGDPGSNRLLAKLYSKLPLKWSKQTIQLGAQRYEAASHLPAMIYPNPLQPSRYVVVNSGLTIPEREYQADYSMPQWGDFAIVKAEGADVPGVVQAGLFDERWRLPVQ
ncbi:MAG: hypothetical protein ABI972_08955 [Acidobacteriota bacterium]